VVDIGAHYQNHLSYGVGGVDLWRALGPPGWPSSILMNLYIPYNRFSLKFKYS